MIFPDPEQKTEFYNEMAKKLLVFEDELERDNYIEALAARYRIRTHDIKKLVAKKERGYGRNYNKRGKIFKECKR